MATVLIVDDRPEIRTLMKSVVEREGHRALVAVDAMEARGHLTAGERPDLLVVDVAMPNETGIELATKLRNTREHAELPILFVTADPESASEAKLPGKAPVEVISKPFRFDQIADMLKRLL